MLSKQKEKPRFTGGLDTKYLEIWHIEEIERLKTDKAFFAYDEEKDYEPLVMASEIIREVTGKTNRGRYMCYVLIGYPKDTFEKAEIRLRRVVDLGMTPMAMLYRDKSGIVDKTWQRFQREWIRPQIIFSKQNQEGNLCTKQNGTLSP
jgi:hypothetical protein